LGTGDWEENISISPLLRVLHLTFPVKSENPCTPPEAGGSPNEKNLTAKHERGFKIFGFAP